METISSTMQMRTTTVMISMTSKLLEEILDKTVSVVEEIVTFLRCSTKEKAIQAVAAINKRFRYKIPCF